MGNFRDKGLPIQYCLIQVGNRPALGNIKAKAGRELFRRFRRHGILPGAERGQKLPVPVERQQAVHHGADAHDGNAVPIFDTGNGRFQAGPGILQGVSPDAVFKRTFPGIIPGGNRREGFVDGYRLDTGGAQFNS